MTSIVHLLLVDVFVIVVIFARLGRLRQTMHLKSVHVFYIFTLGKSVHILLHLPLELVLILIFLVHEGHQMGLLLSLLLPETEVLFVLSGLLDKLQTASRLLIGTYRLLVLMLHIVSNKALLRQPPSELVSGHRSV